MDREKMLEIIITIIVLVCLLLLLMILIKKIIRRIKSAVKKADQSKSGKRKASTTKKKNSKEQVARIPAGVNIPKENEYDNDYTALLRTNRQPELADDDEDTQPMYSANRGPQVELVSDTSGETYRAVCDEQILVGRKSVCDIQIHGDRSVSGVHCIIRHALDDRFIIRDSNSSNGTYINDRAVTG